MSTVSSVNRMLVASGRAPGVCATIAFRYWVMNPRRHSRSQSAAAATLAPAPAPAKFRIGPVSTISPPGSFSRPSRTHLNFITLPVIVPFMKLRPGPFAWTAA